MSTATQESTTATALLQRADDAARDQLALAKPYQAGQGISLAGGLVPRDLDEAAKIAQLLTNSTFVPQAFRGKAGDVLAAILYGLDIGLPPMQALQVVAVINGKPSVYGDGFLAVIQALPTYADHDEFYQVGGQRVEVEDLQPDDLKQDGTAAVCSFFRRGRSKPVTRKFSIGQAKTAQLWAKAGPWQQYPDRMLMFRARGFAGRDCFADGLRGIISSEEALDTPIDVPPVHDVSMPQRQSASLTAARPAEAPAPTETTATPSAAESSAAPAADRILTIERKASSQNKPYWEGTTERGVAFYTWSTSKGPHAEEAQAAGAPVHLAFGDKPWNGKFELTGLTAEANG